MLNLKRTTIKMREATDGLIKEARKLTGKLVGMSYSEDTLGYLNDDQIDILKDCHNFVETSYDYAILQANMLDQMNERLEAIQDQLEDLKRAMN